MNNIVIFDTSIFVDYLRVGRYHGQLEAVAGFVRTSSVVLSELWRGATKVAERDFVRRLQQNHPIVTPSTNQWIESGQLLARIHADKRFAPNKLRDLHFDVLIALTGRSVGGRIITSNRDDFSIIQKYRDFKLEIW